MFLNNLTDEQKQEVLDLLDIDDVFDGEDFVYQNTQLEVKNLSSLVEMAEENIARIIEANAHKLARGESIDWYRPSDYTDIEQVLPYCGEYYEDAFIEVGSDYFIVKPRD